MRRIERLEEERQIQQIAKDLYRGNIKGRIMIIAALQQLHQLTRNNKVKNNNHYNKANNNAHNKVKNNAKNIEIKTLHIEKEAAVLSMITAHHLVVVVISNTATPLLKVKTLRTEKEAAVLLMITAHHLVVVVISNTATPPLKVKTLRTEQKEAAVRVVDDHRSPFSGGSHQQHGNSSS